jgi:hypothetical protein
MNTEAQAAEPAATMTPEEARTLLEADRQRRAMACTAAYNEMVLKLQQAYGCRIGAAVVVTADGRLQPYVQVAAK